MGDAGREGAEGREAKDENLRVGWRRADGGYRTTANTTRTESIGQMPTNSDLIVVQFTDLRHPPSAIENLNAPDLQ